VKNIGFTAFLTAFRPWKAGFCEKYWIYGFFDGFSNLESRFLRKILN